MKPGLSSKYRPDLPPSDYPGLVPLGAQSAGHVTAAEWAAGLRDRSRDLEQNGPLSRARPSERSREGQVIQSDLSRCSAMLRHFLEKFEEPPCVWYSSQFIWS